MNKSDIASNRNKRKALKPMLLAFLVLIISILFVYVIVDKITLSPIEEKRFISLRQDMDSIYSDVVGQNNTLDSKEYTQDCGNKNGTVFSNGEYLCSINISYLKALSNYDELLNVRDTLKDAVAKNKNLELTSGSWSDDVNQYKDMSTYKTFSYVDDKITCEYYTTLITKSNKYLDAEFSNRYLLEKYTNAAQDAIYEAKISCTGETSGDWYSTAR